MNTQKQFEKFYENIKLTKNQREDAKKKYEGVCKKLHDHYYSEDYSGKTKLLIGSYGKKTHIRPARDIDVIFIMPEDKFEQYDDNESNGQSQLLQDIRKILKEKYPDTTIKAFGKVVVLEFSDTQHNVELLPAWENDNKTFIIPNSENGGSWEMWNPRLGIRRVKDFDAKNGKTKSIIRMIKKWSDNCSVKIKSYLIETKVLDFLSFYNVQNKLDAVLIRDFFIFFKDNTEADNVKSHLITAHKRADKACEFEENEDIENATDEWKKVFGDDFPKQKKSASDDKGFHDTVSGEDISISNPPRPWLLK